MPAGDGILVGDGILAGVILAVAGGVTLEDIGITQVIDTTITPTTLVEEAQVTLTEPISIELITAETVKTLPISTEEVVLTLDEIQIMITALTIL